jgi:GNAT superfamily N-acetyltransferase
MQANRPELFLRQCDAADAAELAELRAASLLEMGLLRPSGAASFRRRARREFARMLRVERLAGWLLTIDGEVVGCACAVFWDRLPYPETSLHAEIAGVYVAPEYRRHGYARMLVAEALSSARARGVRRVVLQPGRNSRALYEAFGFNESGQLRLPVERPAF